MKRLQTSGYMIELEFPNGSLVFRGTERGQLFVTKGAANQQALRHAKHIYRSKYKYRIVFVETTYKPKEVKR